MISTCLLKSAFRQSEAYACWRTPSRVRASQLPDAFVSAPGCVRFSSQMRSSLGPDAVASAPAFADRFRDRIVNEGDRGRKAGKIDVNNREMRCFQSRAVFFGLHGSVYLSVFSRGKTSGVVEIFSEETLVGEIHSLRHFLD